MTTRSQVALVTGGAGFIGSHVVEHLLREGWAVRVVDDFSAGCRENLASVGTRVELLEGDVCDEAFLQKATLGVDVIFHLAAKVSVPESFQIPAEYERVNVAGTKAVVAAATAARVTAIVFSSTCAIYGNTADLPIGEGVPASPASPYAATKLAAEQVGRVAAESGGPRFIALRYFNVYGPRQNPASAYSGVISRFAGIIRRGGRPQLHGDGTQTRDFVHVSDVARANLAAARASAPFAIYNVGTGRETSVATLCAHIARVHGRAVEPEYVAAREGDIARSVSDPGRLARELGFRAGIALDDGLTSLLAPVGELANEDMNDGNRKQ